MITPLAYVTRSGFVEGVHHGSAVVVDTDGRVLHSYGTPAVPMLPRSALKPFQLLAMLRAGLRLPAELIALAAASHSGEDFHLAGVAQILAVADLLESDLQNAADLPLGDAERLRWQVAGRSATSTAQNCSGKHAAMLATCRRNGWPEGTYLDPTHPLQLLIVETVAELAGEPVTGSAVDGCGAPALVISLTGLARAFSRLAVAAEDTDEGRICQAIRQHPQWLGGTDREVTDLIRAVPGLIAKDGAESVYAAALPDGRAVTLKITDGSERARQVVMVALLQRLGVTGAALTALADRPVLGHGVPVGEIRAANF